MPKRFAGYELAEDIRYNQRQCADAVNGNLKDNCGGKPRARARGAQGVLPSDVRHSVVTVEQIMRLVR